MLVGPQSTELTIQPLHMTVPNCKQHVLRADWISKSVYPIIDGSHGRDHRPLETAKLGPLPDLLTSNWTALHQFLMHYANSHLYYLDPEKSHVCIGSLMEMAHLPSWILYNNKIVKFQYHI